MARLLDNQIEYHTKRLAELTAEQLRLDSQNAESSEIVTRYNAIVSAVTDMGDGIPTLTKFKAFWETLKAIINPPDPDQTDDPNLT